MTLTDEFGTGPNTSRAVSPSALGMSYYCYLYHTYRTSNVGATQRTCGIVAIVY